jgi:DNA-binding transcriptional ArsR family regulator
LDASFAALADPTRRAMLTDLARHGPRTAGELAAPHAMTLPAVSKHIAVLEKAGMVTRERRGRHQILTLRPAPLRAAGEWLDRHQRFWAERLDSLHIYLRETS